MDEYVLVSCDFHDRLEALATLRQECLIVYRDETGNSIEVRDRIVDVYAAHHADFLKLRNGLELRLDRLISVDGQAIAFCQ